MYFHHLPPALALRDVPRGKVAGRSLHIVCVDVCVYYIMRHCKYAYVVKQSLVRSAHFDRFSLDSAQCSPLISTSCAQPTSSARLRTISSREHVFNSFTSPRGCQSDYYRRVSFLSNILSRPNPLILIKKIPKVMNLNVFFVLLNIYNSASFQLIKAIKRSS